MSEVRIRDIKGTTVTWFDLGLRGEYVPDEAVKIAEWQYKDEKIRMWCFADGEYHLIALDTLDTWREWEIRTATANRVAANNHKLAIAQAEAIIEEEAKALACRPYMSEIVRTFTAVAA